MTDIQPKSGNSSDLNNGSLATEFADWDDRQLIAACLEKNQAAWRALIDRYSRLIYTIPLRFGFSKNVADEIFQETCLILLEQLPTLQHPDRLSAWLVTVCRRTAIQRWRRNEIPTEPLDILEFEPPLDDSSQSFENQLQLIEQRHLVHRALNTLAPRCRAILQARYFQTPPLPYEEIARNLNLPVGSIGPIRARCLEKLRQELEQMEQYEPGSVTQLGLD